METEEYVRKQKPLGKTVVGGESVGLTVIADFLAKQELFYPEQEYKDGWCMGITLDGILEQMESKYNVKPILVLVISEMGMHGEIYKYGNHGDCWERYGETVGYA